MKRSILQPMIALLALIAFSALAVASPPDVKKPPGEVKSVAIQRKLDKLELQADHLHVFARKAIAHKPLEMVDPKTGKKVAADAMIEVNGKKVKAGEYYAKLNALEKKFNAIGYTVTDRTPGPTYLSKSKIDAKELDAHSLKHAAAHLAFAKSMRMLPTFDDIAKKQTSALVNDANRVKALAATSTAPEASQARTITTSKSWNYTLGRKNIMSAYLSGKVEAKGSKDEVSMAGEARAGGYMIGREINLIKANGSVIAPVKGKSKGILHVYLLGQHVVNVDKSGESAWTQSGTKQHGIDVKADFHFAIGPIPMTAHLGARGNAGVRYTLAARPGHAAFQVNPFVDAKVYVKAGVSAFLVSGGGGGEVTLLKDDLKFGAELDLNFDSSRGPVYNQHVYVQNNMNMLSGKVYAWARVNYLFSSKEWRHDLWNWKGLKANGYLFNEHRSEALIPTFRPVAGQAVSPMNAQAQPK